MRRVDPVHRGALADSRREEENLLVGLALLQPIHEIQFRPNPPDSPWCRGRDGANDEFRGTGQIGLIHDIFMAFRMHNDLDTRVFLLEVPHMRRLKHLVYAAEALPQQQPGLLDGLHGMSPVWKKGVPDQQILLRDSHLVRRIATEMFIGKEQNLFAALPGPFDDTLGVGRSARDSTMLTTEGF